MKTILLLATCVVIGVIWGRDRMAAARLRAEVDALRQENSALPTARNERERLRALQVETAQRVQRERETAERMAREAAAAAVTGHTRQSAALTVGEWRAPTSWQNRGQATPAATIETALWAAGGGDLAALQKLLQIDDAVRAKADAIRARLPDAARAAYPTAEHLIAAFATKSLPLGEAQLVWNHQPSADEACACLFVKNPEFVPSPLPAESPPPMTREAAIARAEATREARAKGKQPPAAPLNDATRTLYVTLRRSESAGWQLTVSPGAVDKIAKELSGAK
jgi:hypothetical protein